MPVDRGPRRRRWLPLLAAGALLVVRAVSAQSAPYDATVQRVVVDSVLGHLDRAYVFADTAAAMARAIRVHQSGYAAIETPLAFADTLTAHLQAVSQDVHLRVLYDPDRYAALLSPALPDPDQEAASSARRLAAKRARNYGFREVEMLDGGIGYVDLVRMDTPDGEGGARAVAAMTLVADAEALIIDLRTNPGGDGRMNQFLSSFFFGDSNERWLMTNVDRAAGTERQEWTLPFVPGRRMPETPLYLLVGPGTGSAAEGFAYGLQALGRATVVGRPTAGGAHSGGFVPLAEGFVAFIPSGRVLNPITGSNWERDGVEPDLVAHTADALAHALRLIWEDRQSVATTAAERDRAAWALDVLRAQLNPVSIGAADLRDAPGQYEGAWEIWVESGALHGRKGAGAAMSQALVPLGNGLFVLEGPDLFGVGEGNARARFVRDDSGRVVAMETLIRFSPTQVATFRDERFGTD